MLESFSFLSHREAIKNCIEEKASHVINLFVLECNHARKEFDVHKRDPPIRPGEPVAAGAALWAESIKKSMKTSWDILCYSKYNFGKMSMVDAKGAYDSILSAIEAFQDNHYQTWVDALLQSGEVTECLSKVRACNDIIMLDLCCCFLWKAFDFNEYYLLVREHSLYWKGIIFTSAIRDR